MLAALVAALHTPLAPPSLPPSPCLRLPWPALPRLAHRTHVASSAMRASRACSAAW